MGGVLRRLRPHAGITDATYVELVGSVLCTLLTATVMGILFVIVSSHVVSRTHDVILYRLSGLGIALSLVRVAMLLPHASVARLEQMNMMQARRAERWFAGAFLLFAGLLRAFGTRAVAVAPPDSIPAIIALLVGYAAGVAAGISLRPWIAIPALGLAIAPTSAIAFATDNPEGKLLGFVMGALLAAGVINVVTRFRSESENIALRRAFRDLARRDALTGLANRIALVDLYATTVSANPSRPVAVHCLDLDRFKAVNDQHGHPVGDALLRAVAERLTRLLRAGDVAVRHGGDEFVVLQTTLAHPGEADLFARRIARALSAPYLVDGLILSIGTSIGSAVGDGDNRPLDDLLKEADQASYRAKRRAREVPEAAAQ